MPKLKPGDLIKDSQRRSREVLGVCGTIVHISLLGNRDRYGYTTDEATLKENGYTWDTPAWEPEIGQTYWYIYINDRGAVNDSSWTNDNVDQARRDFLGIYETKELAEASLLEIRRKLGK